MALCKALMEKSGSGGEFHLGSCWRAHALPEWAVGSRKRRERQIGSGEESRGGGQEVLKRDILKAQPKLLLFCLASGAW